MAIKVKKSLAYVEGNQFSITQGPNYVPGQGGMKVVAAEPPPPPPELTALSSFDVMLQNWDNATSTYSSGPLVTKTVDIGFNVVDYYWTLGSPGGWWQDLRYVLNFNPAEGVSTALRATIDGGNTWSYATFDPVRPANVTGQWIIRLKDMTKPGGGLLSTVTSPGSTFTLTVQSSADGSTWSQILELPLTSYEYYT